MKSVNGKRSATVPSNDRDDDADVAVDKNNSIVCYVRKRVEHCFIIGALF
jgi:hypothetical protein